MLASILLQAVEHSILPCEGQKLNGFLNLVHALWNRNLNMFFQFFRFNNRYSYKTSNHLPTLAPSNGKK